MDSVTGQILSWMVSEIGTDVFPRRCSLNYLTRLCTKRQSCALQIGPCKNCVFVLWLSLKCLRLLQDVSL